MPTTECPKLRRMRELIAEEEAAKVRDYRMERQDAAIGEWHSALPGHGNQEFFHLAANLRRAGFDDGEIDNFSPGNCLCAAPTRAPGSDQRHHAGAALISSLDA